MDDFLTTKHARRIWEVSTPILYGWVDDGTLELIERNGKPYVRVSDDAPDDDVKTYDSRHTITVATLRELAAQEWKRIHEISFINRVVLSIPVAVSIGFICAVGGSAGAAHNLGGALIGAGAGILTFALLVARAIWLYVAVCYSDSHHSHLQEIMRRVRHSKDDAPAFSVSALLDDEEQKPVASSPTLNPAHAQQT